MGRVVDVDADRTATCRKGGCPNLVTEGTEWCARHLEETTARRAAVDLREAPPRHPKSGLQALLDAVEDIDR